MAYCGVAKFSAAVVARAPRRWSRTGAPGGVQGFGLLLIMLKVKATSLALNGLPSFHLTPGPDGQRQRLARRWTRLYPVASMGIGAWAELRVLKMNSGSLYSATALVR